MIRVLVVDDHPLAREALRMILSMVPDIDVVGEAEDGFGALGAFEVAQPDVVVMDISMPRLNGFDALGRMKERWPQARVILVTAHGDSQYEARSMDAGARACIRKDVAGKELLPAVYGAVGNGGATSSPWPYAH